jgi:hypothetical protein
MSKRKLLLLTIAAWLICCGVDAYWRMSYTLTEPELHGYEQWEIFHLLAFLVDRFPYWLLALIVVLFAELIILELHPKDRKA